MLRIMFYCFKTDDRITAGTTRGFTPYRPLFRKDERFTFKRLE